MLIFNNPLVFLLKHTTLTKHVKLSTNLWNLCLVQYNRFPSSNSQITEVFGIWWDIHRIGIFENLTQGVFFHLFPCIIFSLFGWRKFYILDCVHVTQCIQRLSTFDWLELYYNILQWQLLDLKDLWLSLTNIVYSLCTRRFQFKTNFGYALRNMC